MAFMVLISGPLMESGQVVALIAIYEGSSISSNFDCMRSVSL